MIGHGAQFSCKKEQAIAALLSQRTTDEAARSIGIGAKTLLRWKQLPEFKTAYLEARREVLGEAAAKLQQASGAAVSTLLKVMVDPNAPAASRIRAADCVLDHAAKTFELEDIEMRVSQLEEAQELSKTERKVR